MSRHNVEIVKQLYDLFTGDEIEAMLSYVDPEIEISQPIPGPERFRGHEGFMAAIDHWTGEFDELRVDVERLIDADDTVIAVVRQRARGRQSGVPVEIRIADVWTLRDGRVLRWQTFTTLDEAFETVGLHQ